MLGKSSAPSPRPIIKVCRWRNSRADYYAMTYPTGHPVDYEDFVRGIRSGTMIPVWGDGSLDEGLLYSVLEDCVIPPSLQAIINLVPVNPEFHAQYVKDKEFEKMINARNKSC